MERKGKILLIISLFLLQGCATSQLFKEKHKRFKHAPNPYSKELLKKELTKNNLSLDKDHLNKYIRSFGGFMSRSAETSKTLLDDSFIGHLKHLLVEIEDEK